MKRPQFINLVLPVAAAGLTLAVLGLVVAWRSRPPAPLLIENEKIYRQSGIPGLPHEHVPGGRGKIVGVDTQINSLGFRGPELPARKPAGAWRAAVLGDSVVFGQGVREEDTLPAQLQRRLSARSSRPVEVINAGVRGYNLAHYRILLEARLLALDPDLLVLVITEINDLEQEPFSWKPPRATRLGPDSLWLRFPLSRWMIQRLDGLDYIPAWQAHVRRSYDPQGPDWKAATEALLAIQRDCVERGVRLLVLQMPLLEDVGTFTRERAQLADFLKRRGFAALDPRPELLRYPARDLVVSPMDFHPNARCLGILAQLLELAILRGEAE
jgi:hypothetical protein